MPSAPTPPAPSSSQADAESFVLTLPDDPASSNDWYLWAGVLVLLVFVAFFPAVTGRFIWDDDHHPGVIPYFLSLTGLGQIWTPQAATPQYYPLTFSTYWLEYHLWQTNTLGYHLDNLLLHAGSAILVWRLLRRLRIGGAWLAAAIWAVHPLQAESVCWISERKNVLSGLLFFSSIWFYLEYDGWTPPAKGNMPGLSADGSTVLLGNKRLAYWLSWISFVLALLAKTVACAMPAVILILTWWRGRKILNRKVLVPLLPFIGAGLALAAVTVFLETASGGNVQARGPDWDLSPVQRLLIAARGIWFYVFKLVWPAKLTFSYPRVLPSPIHWLYVAATVAAFAALWLTRRRFGRGPLAAVLFYAVTIFPALGFINIFPMRYSFVADHFQYLSGLGLIVLAVAALDRAAASFRIPPGGATAVAAAILVALFYPAWVQAHIYLSPETLWRDTLAKNPSSWMAYDNLGVELITLGELKQRDATNDRQQDQPDVAAADAQEAQDHYQEAEQLFNRALELRPQNYASYNALGLLYRQTNRWQEAESELRTAVDMDRQDDPAHQLIAPYVNYAQVLQHNHPDIDVRPWLDMAMALTNQPHSRIKDAAVADMAYGDYWCRQAGNAARTGRTDDESADLSKAINVLKQGLKTLPDDVEGLYNMALAFQRMGLIDQQRADRERAAGDLAAAAGDEYKSHQIDDLQAMQNYMAVLDRVQYHRNAGALEGIGELYFRNTIECTNQADAVTDLLTAMQFFKDALATDPTVPNAAQYLKLVERNLMDQAAKARAHEAAWVALRLKTQALADGEINTTSVAAADAAARDVLWVLPKGHPSAPFIQAFRGDLRSYLSSQPPSAPAAVHDAAASLLKTWTTRNAAQDAVTDAVAAALCYQGAITANDRSAEAWLDLRSQADILTQAAAATPDAPGLKEALRVALFVLDQHRAATQPATQPATLPTAK